MVTELVSVGFGNIVAMNRVITMLSPGQEPARRLVREARNNGLLIDATHARKMKAMLLLDSGHVVITAVSPETLASRLAASRGSSRSREEQSEAKCEP